MRHHDGSSRAPRSNAYDSGQLKALGGSMAGAREQNVETAVGDALCRLLAEGAAFTEISVDQIAREAKVARSTFYVYYDDKAKLLRSLSDIAIAEILGVMKAWTSAPATLPHAAFLSYIDELTQAYMRHRTVMAAMMEISSFDPPTEIQFTHFLADATATLESHIRDGQVVGVSSPDVDAHRMAEWLVGMTERGLSRIATTTGTTSIDAIVASLTTIIWNVLYRGRA